MYPMANSNDGSEKTHFIPRVKYTSTMIEVLRQTKSMRTGSNLQMTNIYVPEISR